MIFQNSCAYHPTQSLTNFCRCRQCLLPVCPTCIKLHSQEHQLKQSIPDYEKIEIVFEQVQLSYNSIIKGIVRLREQLIEVQQVKKQNQLLIIEKIKLYRNKLIRQFERALTDMEYDIIKKIENEDQQFISQIEELDKYLFRVEKDVQSHREALKSQSNLRAVIFALNNNVELEYLKLMSDLSQKLKNMLTKNIYLSVEETSLEDIKLLVHNFIKLGKIDWALNEGKQ